MRSCGTEKGGDLRAELRALRDEIDAKDRRLEEMHHDLEKAVARYDDLWEGLQAASLILDGAGVIVDANPSALRFLARSKTQLTGRPFVLFLPKSYRVAFLGHMRRCRNEGSARTRLELVGNGRVVAIDLDSRPIRGGNGRRSQFRTEIVDLTERMRAEKAGAKAERERQQADARELAARTASEAKDRFLAELSHELRTPLTPILASVRALLGRGDLAADLRGPLELMRRNVEVEARLIDDLLDVSRIDSGRLKLELGPVDAHQTLADVLVTLAPEIDESGVECEVEMGAREHWVLGEPLRLSHILWNLVANAIRNTPPDGKVVVTTANFGCDFRFIVRDTGLGIEPDSLEKIFSPFYNQPPAQKPAKEGLGLGLAIVKGLVDAHRGRIFAFSPGRQQGATFVVELLTTTKPARADDVAEPPRDLPAEIRGTGTRVLLVEDHPDTRAALEAFLRVHGYDVILAADSRSAIEMARGPVDVLVCDIGLPDGSGLDVVRRIHEEKPVKAIALSGYGSARDVALSTAAGFSVHLVKPVGAEHLLESIELVLGTRDLP